MSGINFKESLNAEQYAAVTGSDGPLLILAAAGTGKTRTLVYRVAYLVEQGVSAGSILLLTFTNRAAREMLERAASLVGRKVGGIWGGTFHHMANRMLRRHAQAIGYSKDYTILDSDDSRQLVRDCVRELGLSGKEFPKANVLLAVAGVAANTRVSLEDAAASHFKEHGVDAAKVIRVLEAYTEKKRRLGAMDFDDLLVNGLKLLTEHPKILAKYQEKFRYVLVDEYQDTNVVQSELIDNLAAGHGNILVVGDDFQSIYSWRGADFQNIVTFPDRYASTQTFTLETNYRSVPEILDLANACIAGNPEQFQKTLRPTRGPHKRPILVRVRDGEQQATYVIDLISRLEREGFKRSNIVVLYRAHYHAMELQMVLTRRQIPYIITSGVRFFEQAHIKDVCSIVRLSQNPGDELAFSRLLCLLPRVGKRTAVKLWDKLGSRFSVLDNAAAAALRGMLPHAAADIWSEIEDVLRGYEDQNLKRAAGEIIRRFVTVFYKRHAVNTFENHERRLEDIRELIAYASRFANVEAFLSELALFSNLDAEVRDTGVADQDVLKLSTVHQAKGLEWGVVIVLWATEGMFPSARSLLEAEGDAEERRLSYVAITRAKDELYLCVPEMRRRPDGGVMPYRPSRFISEVAGDLFENSWG